MTGYNRYETYPAPSSIALLLFLVAAILGCRGDKETIIHDPPLFKVLDNRATGIHFRNDLKYSNEFNLFKYIYFYNGSGLGAGDFNNDGKIDLFFGSNQGRNSLYLNKGEMRFTDATEAAAIPDDHGWTTGVSVVDINNDRLLDIYVCRVGNFETLKSKNLLLVNQGVGADGVPLFRDEAASYGLDFSGFSTQAAFFDYDLDGDLDLFLMNHSVHQNGTFRPRADFSGTYHPLSGDRFYRNDNGKYTDATKAVGISSTAIGYGLAIAISDFNLDGYPDVYVGNDFHENDYLYINQGDGTFKDKCTDMLMHTSQYTMGADAADVNNDGWPEIITTDMLPSDPNILKRSLGEDAYDILNFKIKSGYGHQYSRNQLQYNRRNGLFSEVGFYSGIAATDWSWASLWVDFDNDGLKDLFIANGIPKRLNDIDYVNFISNSEIQQRINTNSLEQKNISLINNFPQIKLPDKFYRNEGDLHFADSPERIEGQKGTYSNGAVYADLDNDGDYDIVTSNIDDEAIIYENNSGSEGRSASMELLIEGPPQNRNAIGARLIIFCGNEIRTYEKFPAKGFMSSMEIPFLIGTKSMAVDSAFLIWPDNSFVRVSADTFRQRRHYAYRGGLAKFDFSVLRDFRQYDQLIARDITAETGLTYAHRENEFAEFDRESLLPHMLSTEGPAVATADINHDGLEDLFFGSARGQPDAVFFQLPSGRFKMTSQPDLSADSTGETTGAVLEDLNGDGFVDLIAVNGGNEFYGPDRHNTPRVYLNDRTGRFIKKEDAFDNLFLTASSVAASDFTGDGFPDIFIGSRTVPWDYGLEARSYLLANDGKGKFTEVTKQYTGLEYIAGYVTSASWSDVNADSRKDLLCTFEWGTPAVFIFEKGRFVKRELTNRKGWWTFLLPVDLDNDGDIDFIAGNLGKNSRLQASVDQPVQMYYNDFDDNGKKEQILTYYLGGKEIPMASKAELEKQIPGLKKKFLYARDFAKASIEDLFAVDKLKGAAHFSADYFSSAVFLNKGQFKFEMMELPYLAQLSQLKNAVMINANDDGLPDFFVAGNYYDNRVEMLRSDADFGTLLINLGNGRFTGGDFRRLPIKGQVRSMQKILIRNQPAVILGINDDTARVIVVGRGLK